MARYAALAACCYILGYLGAQIIVAPTPTFAGLALLPSLAAGGMLLARERRGGTLAVTAGVICALQGAVGLVIQLSRGAHLAGLGGPAALLGYLLAALVLAGAGGVVARRARESQPISAN